MAIKVVKFSLHMYYLGTGEEGKVSGKTAFLVMEQKDAYVGSDISVIESIQREG